MECRQQTISDGVTGCKENKTGEKMEKKIFRKECQERGLWRGTNRVQMSQVNKNSVISNVWGKNFPSKKRVQSPRVGIRLMSSRTSKEASVDHRN